LDFRGRREPGYHSCFSSCEELVEISLTFHGDVSIRIGQSAGDVSDLPLFVSLSAWRISNREHRTRNDEMRIYLTSTIFLVSTYSAFCPPLRGRAWRR
jgi:hypothetical protein